MLLIGAKDDPWQGPKMKVLDELLTHVRKHNGIWFAMGRDVAEFWMKKAAKS